MDNEEKKHHKQLSFKDINLQESKSNNPFEVPEGYFDQLPSQITDEISNINRKASPKIIFIQRIVSVAAIFTIVIVSAWYLYFMEQDLTQQQISVTYDDILETGFVAEIDENTIINHYLNTQPESSENTQTENIIDEYEDYLINNDVDINILINEL